MSHSKLRKPLPPGNNGRDLAVVIGGLFIIVAILLIIGGF